MDEDDLSFYRRRLDEEQAREREAATPEVASAHRLLAQMYAQRLEEFASPPIEPAMFRKERQAEANQMKRRRLSLKM